MSVREARLLPDFSRRRCDIVVIGASLGGMAAFRQLLGALPAQFPLPIAIVHQMGEGGNPLAPALLQQACALLVREPESQEAICAGRVYFAPQGHHLLVGPGVFELSVEALVSYSRPSIDVFFESAAASYGEGVLGILLSGANEDGARGLLSIRRAGGMTLVQDPLSAEASTMPAAALRLRAADEGHSLDILAQILARMRPKPASGRLESAASDTDRTTHSAECDAPPGLVAGLAPTNAAAPTQRPASQRPASQLPASQLPAVLIVDDSPLALTSFAEALASPDWFVVTARSGEEALRRLLEPIEYALVLLDLRMPGMDGFEVASLMHQRARHAQLPICFISGSLLEPALVQRAYAVGAVDFIAKPVDFELLHAKVTVFTRLWSANRRLAAANHQLEQQAHELARARDREAQARSVREVRRDALLSQRQALLDLVHLQPATLAQTLSAISACTVELLRISGARYWRWLPQTLELICEPSEPSEPCGPAGAPVPPEGQYLLSGTACARFIEAVQAGHPLAVADALNDARTLALAASWLVPSRVASLLAVGVHHQGALHGVLCVEHSGAPRHWDEQEEGFLLALAESVALVLATEQTQLAVAALRERSDELERSNRDLEQFAYLASHDLQEPLRMVRSYTRLLQERYTGRLDADADNFLGFAADGAARMHKLIDDLLAYALLGRRGAELGPVSIGAALECARLNLAGALDEAGARIECAELPVVLGNATQLAQLLQNLVGNALKYRGEAAPLVRISARRVGEFWEFACVDNGIGIAPEHHMGIFEMFQRLHPRGEKGGGTGIGLALCRRIVQTHGGELRVASAPGQGATFTFTLRAPP